MIHLCPLGLFPRGDERSPSREGTSALRVVLVSVHVIESAVSDLIPLRAKRTTVEPDANRETSEPSVVRSQFLRSSAGTLSAIFLH